MGIARLRHDAENARTIASLNAMNKPAAIMDAKAQSFAHDYYLDDIKHNITPQMPGDYYSRGLAKANPNSYGIDARSDTAQFNKQMDALKEELKGATGDALAIAKINQRINDLTSGRGPTSVGLVRPRKE